MLRLDVCPQNTWRMLEILLGIDERHQEKLYFMSQTTHNTAKLAPTTRTRRRLGNTIVARKRQDKTTTPTKARSHESHSAATKKCRSLMEINSSQRDTALCSAVLAQSGTDVMLPLIP